MPGRMSQICRYMNSRTPGTYIDWLKYRNRVPAMRTKWTSRVYGWITSPQILWALMTLNCWSVCPRVGSHTWDFCRRADRPRTAGLPKRERDTVLHLRACLAMPLRRAPGPPVSMATPPKSTGDTGRRPPQRQHWAGCAIITAKPHFTKEDTVAQETLQILKDLIDAPSPSGFEQPAQAVYRRAVGRLRRRSPDRCSRQHLRHHQPQGQPEGDAGRALRRDRLSGLAHQRRRLHLLQPHRRARRQHHRRPARLRPHAEARCSASSARSRST